jgi:uncharacterized integral membrane protein
MANQPGLPTDGPPPPSGTRGADIARIVAVLVAVVLLVAFIAENSSSVTVHFVFFTAHVRLIWALIVAAVLGLVVDRLIIYLMARRRAGGTKARGKASKRG